MEDVDITQIKRKSLTGIVALTSRTFLLQIIAFAGTFLLTVFLSPAVFGIFYVVSAVISFLAYFSDIGLAAALIQKKETLTRDDLVTTFTIQQVLVVTAAVIAYILSPVIAGFYGLDVTGLWLLRALIMAFFVSSLKTTPSIILERKLDFQALVIPQILETFGFYITAVVLAWKGMGLLAFVWAVMIRALVGLVSIYILCPWKPALGISRPAAKKLLRFGIPFQLNSFLALVKDDLLTVFLGKILPFQYVGYIGWAKKWAEVPLRLIMDSIVRVTFPAFSRLQHSKELLGIAVDKTLFGLALTIFPITATLLFLVEPLVKLIPKYGKWEPAIFSFSLLAISSAVSGLSVPLTNTLNAIGKIKITLTLMVMWTVLTWFVTVICIQLFGYNGVAISFLGISATIVIVIRLVKNEVPFSFISDISFPLLGSLLLAGWFTLTRGMFTSVWGMVLSAIPGGILYIGFMWITQQKKIREILTGFAR